ncbi:hypothetical protein MMPV_002910 [Pyropia vietnamensis]
MAPEPVPKTVRVVGAGFGRTGTLSLKSALEILYGGPCYHMSEVMFPAEATRLDDLAIWDKATAAGRAPDWATLLDSRGYVAAVDFPTCIYYKELADRYPDAKVILTVRSTESWLASFKNLVSAVNNGSRLGWFLPRMAIARRWLSALIFTPMGSPQALHGGELNAAAAAAAYEAHNAAVKATIPAERLLVMELGAGWDPLCTFLGLPVPDVPYPRTNAGGDLPREFQRRLVRLTTMSLQRFVGEWRGVLAAAVAMGVAVRVAYQTGYLGN